MRRRPPRSTLTDTLFPYTTLFRSWASCAESLGRRHGVAPGRQRLRCAPVDLALAQHAGGTGEGVRSEEHTSELQSLMRTSYAVFCLNNKKKITASICKPGTP